MNLIKFLIEEKYIDIASDLVVKIEFRKEEEKIKKKKVVTANQV